MFLAEPPDSAEVAALYDADRASDGYVNNLTQVWAWRPDVLEAFLAARNGVLAQSSLTDLDVAVLVTATASARRDSYCSLAWGARLAALTDREIFDATAYVAFRLAFLTVNDALGAQPDRQLADAAPAGVRAAASYGRIPAPASS